MERKVEEAYPMKMLSWKACLGIVRGEPRTSHAYQAKLIILGGIFSFFTASCLGIETKENVSICELRKKVEELNGRYINLSGYIVTLGPESKAVIGEDCPNFIVLISPLSGTLESEMEKGIIEAAEGGSERAFSATLSGRIKYMEKEGVVILSAWKMRGGQVIDVRTEP